MITSLVFAALAMTLCAAAFIFWPRQAKLAADQSQKELFKERLQLLVQARDYGELAEEDFASAAAELKSQFLQQEQQRLATPVQRHYRLEWLMFVSLMLIVAVSYGLQGHYQQLSQWESAQQRLPEFGERSLLGKGEPLTDEELALFGLALRTKLAREGDDAVAWFVLGRLWFSQGYIEEAIESFERALRMTPDRTTLLLSYAQALLVTESAENLQRAARSLGRVLELEPSNQDALAMLALLAQERGDIAEARAAWQVLLDQLPTDDPRHAVIAKQMAELPVTDGNQAENNAATASTAAAADVPSAANPEPTRPARGIVVTLKIPTAMAQQFSNATLFVLARAHAGPPMPLAVQKLDVFEGERQIELTSEMVMQPGWGLDNVDQVQVVARISQSGNVSKTAGDPEVISDVIDLSRGWHELTLTMEPMDESNP